MIHPVQGRVRLVVVDGDQRIKTFAHRCRQALGHALRQQRPGLVSGRPYRAAQHRIGRCENVLVAEPGARPSQQRGGPLKPQRLVLKEPRQPFSAGGIESAQTQVLADALLMLRDRLLRRPGCLREGAKSYAKDSDGYKVVNCTRAQPVFHRFGRLARGKVISVTVLRTVIDINLPTSSG